LVPAIVGPLSFVALCIIFFKLYRIWVQRHAIFNLLDIPEDIVRSKKWFGGAPVPGYTKRGLLLETCKFPRPVQSSQSESVSPEYYPLNEAQHPLMWHFITSKFRSDFDLSAAISRIEFVRMPERTEAGFVSKLFADSRADSILPDSVRFEVLHKNQIDTPLFQEGLMAYNETFCSKLVPGLDRIKIMFAWHGCKGALIKNLCESGIKKVAVQTDPGFFGEACYLSPEVPYAVRYSNFHPPNENGEIGVILFACECPKYPYVVTAADYPIALPPVRDHDIPYGFSKFFGRQMQLACSAHWVSVKRFNENHNHLNYYFGSDISWQGSRNNGINVLTHVPSGKMVRGDVKPTIPPFIDDLLRAKYTEVSKGVYQFQPESQPGHQYLLENPDVDKYPSILNYPNVLVPSLLDYQYHQETGCEGHELVLKEGMSFPIAVVYFKKAPFDAAASAAASAAAGGGSARRTEHVPPPDVSLVSLANA
jgi:hypothetical protein